VALTTLSAHDTLTRLRAERSAAVQGSVTAAALLGWTLKPHVRMSELSVLNPSQATAALGSALSFPWTTCNAACDAVTSVVGAHTHSNCTAAPCCKWCRLEREREGQLQGYKTRLQAFNGKQHGLW